jgi:PIN domain nuclease of toxin-antitoxin system
MMRLLLDTHTFLWLLEGNSNLSPLVRDLLESTENHLYLSIVSFWEIAIKLGLGKLEIECQFEDLQNISTRFDIEILPITVEHTKFYLDLPLHHRDPFDRMLVAQTISNSLILVSRDTQLDSYPVQRFWS